MHFWIVVDPCSMVFRFGNCIVWQMFLFLRNMLLLTAWVLLRAEFCAATSRVMCMKILASLFTVTQWENLWGILYEYFRHYLLFENCKTFVCILNLRGVATECGILNFLHEFATGCRLLIFALYADALIISQKVWIFPLWYASYFPFSHRGINHKQYYYFILKFN
jgi:hypothetical protein